MIKQTKNQKKIEKLNNTEKRKLLKFLNFISKGFTPYLILVFIILGVYFQTLSYGVTGLDDDFILKNANSILVTNNALVAFKSDAGLSYPGSQFYRPMQGLSFIIDAKIGKTNPFYSHLSNLLVHIITCCFLFYLISMFNNDKKISLFLTLIFSVHPLFNQAVIWLPSRGDLLVSLFSLMSFIAYIKFIYTKNYIFFFINIITFFFAVFSKEIAILLPIIFLLYYYFKEKNIKKTFNINNITLGISWSLIIITYLSMRAYFINVFMNPGQFGIKAFIYNLPVIPEFISKFFIPFNLSVLPEFNIIAIFIGLLIITCIIFFSIKYKEHFGDYSFLFFIWLILFAITPMFYRHEHLNNAYDYLEHRAYLPLIGIVILIGLIKYNHNKLKIIIISDILVFLIFTSITITRESIFKDPESFYNSAIERGTKVAFAYYNRGNLFKDSGNKTAAIQDYSRAIEIKPDYSTAYYNRGIMKNDFGDLVGAKMDYNHAIEINPNYAEAYCNLGLVKNDLGDSKDAIRDYNKAIMIKPDFALAFSNRGYIKQNTGDFNGALEDYNSAIKLKPDFAMAYNNRGQLKKDMGDIKGAFQDLDKAISINHNYAEAYFGRGNTKMDLGDYLGAKEDYNNAIRIKPNFELAYNNLGILFVKMNDYNLALYNFTNAVKIKPNYIDAWNNLGFTKQDTKDMKGACEAWSKAAALGNIESKVLLEKFCK